MTTPQDVLSRVPLFSMLPEKDLDKLAREADERTYPAGAVLTKEGTSGR